MDQDNLNVNKKRTKICFFLNTYKKSAKLPNLHTGLEPVSFTATRQRDTPRARRRTRKGRNEMPSGADCSNPSPGRGK